MRVVTRAKEVVKLVRIIHLIHRNCKDIFYRVFVMHGKVLRIVGGQRVTTLCNKVAIVYTGLPCVKLLPVNIEEDAGARGVRSCSPVVVGIHLGVER